MSSMASPVVTVSQGQLRGCVHVRNIDGDRFFSFLGIPYGKPPIGELRFKAPLPAEPWEGIRDATQEGNACYARNGIKRLVSGSEDCLFLNVFTSELPQSSSKLKPVMVWIHGGGFVTGSNKTSMYGPELLMTEDIVLVTINYRLGVLGFLSLADPSLEVPGNAGLKDQALALKWVKQNIMYFNGDPNNVTLCGESAGAVSVHYHILSKSSEGLFHKAILQSGTALNSWAYGFRVAVEFANYMGYGVTTEKEALEALRDTPIDELYDSQEKFMNVKEIRSRGRPFGPVIELPNDTAIITKDPIDIMISGEYNQVPMLFGYTTREGMLMDAFKHKKTAKTEGETPPPDSEEVILSHFNLQRGTEVAHKVYKRIKEVYFKGPDKDDDARLLTSDAVFIAGILAAVKNHLTVQRDPIYLYRMSLITKLNYFKNYASLHHLPGVCHGDDLGYIFKSALTPEIEPGSLEDISFRRFVKLWTNFARYGNPTPDQNAVGVIWSPVQKDKINYLDIGSELTPGTNPEPERMALWKELYQLNPETAKYL